MNPNEGTVLEGLSFESKSQETFNSGQPTVLSCGGIFIPKRRIPEEMKRWQQIINLPGTELSAKIFGFSSAGQSELDRVLSQEQLN